MSVRAQAVGAVAAVDAGDRFRGAAPSRQRKAEASELLQDRAPENADAEQRHSPFGREPRWNRLPQPDPLVRGVLLEITVQEQDGGGHILHHHPGDALVDHAHETHAGRQRRAGELVDAGADAEDELEIGVAGDIRGRHPGHDEAHVLGRYRRRIGGEVDLRQLLCEDLREDRGARGIAKEEEGHGCRSRPARRIARLSWRS